MILVVVTWFLALGMALALGVSATSRVHTRTVGAALALAHARSAAESAIWLAVDNLRRADTPRWPVTGEVIERELHGAKVALRIQAQTGLVDLNRAPERLVVAVLEHALPDSSRAAVLTDEILDWRDADSVRRPQGAEREDYEASGLLYGPRDGAFNSREDLRLLATVTQLEYDAIVSYFTVHSPFGRVIPEHAPEFVLRAIPGLNTERMDTILTRRSRGPSADGEPREPARAPSRQRTSFEISAEATYGAAVRRTRAIVALAATQPEPVVLEWRDAWQEPAAGGAAPRAE